MGGSAWVTLATNDSYSLGALVLAHSLKQTGTVHQLAVLVTPGVTSAMREKLASVFNLVQEVNILDSRDEANLRLLKRPELGITFTKLHCWRLTQFDKCVFLDADTLVLKNSDELFEREELSAAPDVGWPDCFNSGVFVYRPSLETYDKLIQFALEKGSFDGGDQGLLNSFFSDWAHKDISRHLPFIYNLCSTACYSYLPAFKQFGGNAKIIHFIGAQKPWLQYFNTETKKVQPSGESSHLQEVLQLWWDIFCSLIHPHLSPAMQGQSQHGMSPSYFPPEFHPSPNPTASADDYESAWDPWDEYDKKMSQNTNNSLISTHYNQNQPIESLNTNTSPVANQPSIHSHSQLHNYNTYTVQNNGYYQPSNPHIPVVVYQNIPRAPTPPPTSHPVYSPAQFFPPIENSEQNLQPQSFSSEQPPQPADDHYYPTEAQQQHQFQVESQQFSQPHETDELDHYDHQPQAETHFHEQHQPHFTDQLEVHEQLNSPSPVRSRSPNPSDPTPVLSKECEATTTVSNSRSFSNTIEENSNHEDAGLAGAYSQLTLGVARTAEQDALENVLRKQAWEVGNIDYSGKDSFANIWSKISETLSAAPPQPEKPVAAEPKLSTASAEPEIAPAESQSQKALQDVATPDLPPVPPIDPKVDSPEPTPAQKPLISPEPESVLPQPPLESVPAEVITEPAQESPVEIQPAAEIKDPDAPVPVAKEAGTKEPTAEVPVVAEKIEETVIAPPTAADAEPLVPGPETPASAPEASPAAPVPTLEPKPAETEVIEAPKPDTAATPAAAETPVEAPKPEASQAPPAAELSTPEPSVLEAASVAAAAAPESTIAEEATAKPLECPLKTKVVEATPPATPGTPPATPPVEKTKQALTAEAVAPQTPPPSEGASTPTPPPRKTDKPKKVAAKPKK